MRRRNRFFLIQNAYDILETGFALIGVAFVLKNFQESSILSKYSQQQLFRCNNFQFSRFHCKFWLKRRIFFCPIKADHFQKSKINWRWNKKMNFLKADQNEKLQYGRLWQLFNQTACKIWFKSMISWNKSTSRSVEWKRLIKFPCPSHFSIVEVIFTEGWIHVRVRNG